MAYDIRTMFIPHSKEQGDWHVKLLSGKQTSCESPDSQMFHDIHR
jgi:hypothetical protein